MQNVRVKGTYNVKAVLGINHLATGYSLRVDNTKGKGVVCATPLNIVSCMSHNFISIAISFQYLKSHLLN